MYYSYSFADIKHSFPILGGGGGPSDPTLNFILNPNLLKPQIPYVCVGGGGGEGGGLGPNFQLLMLSPPLQIVSLRKLKIAHEIANFLDP